MMAEQVIAGLMDCMDVGRQLGYPPPNYEDAQYQRQIRRKIELLLAAHGYDMPDRNSDSDDGIAHDLLLNHREKTRLLQETAACPVVRRLQAFIDAHLGDAAAASATAPTPKVPRDMLVLTSHGLARELAFPRGGDSYASETLTSFRLGLQGVLHNPKNDKRTTQGSFHIAEGGLPISADKLRVPKHVFAKMLDEAFHPPAEASVVPYTAGTGPGKEAHAMVSLLVRPIVCPRIPGVCEARSMEVIMFAPGTLVSCLDFVESIFGNAGDPYLPQNDAALDVEHWSGHTGCIVLAPHLVKLTKKHLGLPRYEDATPMQREQGMCWKDETELYNGGRAFKCCCRTEAGVIITVIGDSYYGYCAVKGTPVSISDGLSIPIESISPSSKVASFGQQKKLAWCPYEISSAPGITAARSDGNTFMGIRECVTVDLFDGSQLTLTPDHRVLV
jgi:hypothetical protein